MWVYGIRLFLTESTKEAKSSAFDDIIQAFLSNASNGKMSPRSEMMKKIFAVYDKREITRNYTEKLLETHALDSKYDKCINRSNNEKEFSNCENNYEQSNAIECTNGVVRRDNETKFLNCEENYKELDADIKTCIDNTKSGIFNYKDFIQTFLSNTSNDKMSQESDMIRMFGLYDKFDDNEIINNEQLYQKILGTLTSDSNLFKCKNEIVKADNGKDRLSHEIDEKSDSFEYKNKNIRNNDEECSNCEDYKKSDVDIRIYIDNKFHDMEKRLMTRIDEMEANTNQKLNAILEKLETQLNLE